MNTQWLCGKWRNMNRKAKVLLKLSAIVPYAYGGLGMRFTFRL